MCSVLTVRSCFVFKRKSFFSRFHCFVCFVDCAHSFLLLLNNKSLRSKKSSGSVSRDN